MVIMLTANYLSVGFINRCLIVKLIKLSENIEQVLLKVDSLIALYNIQFAIK